MMAMVLISELSRNPSPSKSNSGGRDFASPTKARAVKDGGPTHMKRPGRCSLCGRPEEINRPIMCAYIIVATAMLRPWQVRPAVIMDTALAEGWVLAMTEAMVPESMMGKIRRI